MNELKTLLSRRWLPAASLLALACAACSGEADVARPGAGPVTEPPARKTPVGKNVVVEVDGKTGARRVIVSSEVVLREGQLEGFLTRKGGKEHEYILAADCDAKDIHKALLVAGAEAGQPVRFGPGNTVTSATGSMIRVSLRFTREGKSQTVPASAWITNAINNKPLEHDWVFGGSRLIPDPDNRNRPPYYEANIGDLIAVVNMPSAMLDLPVPSAKALEMRQYVANKTNIPPLKTPVDVILEVLPEKKGAPAPDEPADSAPSE